MRLSQTSIISCITTLKENQWKNTILIAKSDECEFYN